MGGGAFRGFIGASVAAALSIALPARADEPPTPLRSYPSAPSADEPPADAADAGTSGADAEVPAPTDTPVEPPPADVDANPPLPPQPPKPEEAPPMPKPAPPARPKPAPAPPSPSSAEVWSTPPEAEVRWPSRHRVWYGYQTLAVDAVSLAALAGDQPEAGAVGYVFGAPLVHAIHGHAGKAFGSFGMRLGMPVGGALVGAVVGCVAQGNDRRSGGDGCLAGAAVGFILGMGGAIAIDAAVIAREDAPERSAGRARRVGVVPTLALTPRRGSVGVAGWF